MATPIKGRGTLLACQFSAPTYTTIAARISIGGFNQTLETIDVTNLDSTAREFIVGMLENGELPFKIHYDPDDSTHIALRALMTTPVVKSWRITFTDSTPTTYTFNAYLTQFNIGEITFDGVVEADCVVKVTGAITVA